ncbi:MAG: HAD family hydrolase [Endomicrobiales bacterium]|nr:HAD family hydrolase [Endomicrobiales bacterium]
MATGDRKNRAVFIDRDGTLIHEKNYLHKIKDVRFYTRAVEALKKLKALGYRIIVVTNQSGIGRGYFKESDLKKVHAFLARYFSRRGVRIDAIYYCPHAPDAGCSCRKPRLGLVKKAQKRFNLDLKKSYVIGDHNNDFLLGKNMGGKGIFILTGHGKEEIKKIKDTRPDRIEKNLLSAAKWIGKQD